MHLLLLSMPWAQAHRPSIQLAVLSAFLRHEAPDITVTARHPTLAVAQSLGHPAYQAVCDNSWAAEALYSGLLFPELAEQSLAVARRQLGRHWSGPPLEDVRHTLSRHLENLAADPLLNTTDLLGFSVCFSQLCASLAAARRIKARHPHLRIVFGGSSCTRQSAPALLRLMPQLDHVICGEGEAPLLALCRFIQGHNSTPGAAVLSRDTPLSPVQQASSCQQAHLDHLPLPDFDDFFQELERQGRGFFPELPVEFSRGCWWNRCAFCNLNLQWRGYRHKSARRMWEEITALRDRHACLDFSFTDNALPPQEAEQFFRLAAQSGTDLRFFGEIRATTTASSLAVFAQGGLRAVQFGIEALSDSLLRRMRKGTRTIDNIAAMKHALAAGMAADGNLILEFPSSTDAEAEETMKHLDFVLPFRPLKPAAFFLGQGSPVWEHPRQFALRGRTVHPLIRRLFPPRVHRELNFLVAAAQGDRQVQRRRWRPVRKKMAQWQHFHQQRPQRDIPALSFRDGGDFLLIRQELPGKAPLRHRLRGIYRQIYLACDEPCRLSELQQLFSALPPEQMRAFLAGMQAKRLLFADDEQVLALAVSEDRKQKIEDRGRSDQEAGACGQVDA